MSGIKFSGSVSRAAFEAALADLEQQVAGRVPDEQVEQLFGARVARLREMGILSEALINLYVRKAGEEDSAGLVDEAEQARLILARYDERHAVGRRKRRSKEHLPRSEEGKPTTAAGRTSAGGFVSSQNASAAETVYGSKPTGRGDEEDILGAPSSKESDGDGRER